MILMWQFHTGSVISHKRTEHIVISERSGHKLSYTQRYGTRSEATTEQEMVSKTSKM